MNRTEYAASVKALVGVDVNEKDSFRRTSRSEVLTISRPF